ncbi:uncharacterized protein LOC130995478 isoform X2 [Salvia miltiorrhiza]|uniref:uncharacterized protein LOC130995478 isoform X2 n=1 Tax=Salvia miltiorrhiza TaxID=226208 RepID=UPI0025AB8761|nr:uncharacterized protein LOC130995478 isoform X2 [Salvia miltiorrhiza]
MEERGKGVKRGYCDSTETVQPVVIVNELQPVLIVNEPGYVAAVGGIPDHLKIKGGLSYGIRFPISKYPKNLPEDPIERRRAFFKDFEDIHTQKKPRRACSLCKQLLPEEYFIVHINSSGNHPADFYDSRAPESIPSQSMEEREEDGCSYHTIENGAVVINEPGFVAVVGGIPQDLKINDGISFSTPCPVLKYPKVMPEDPTERQNVIYECYKKGMESDAFINAFLQAYIKAKSEAQGLSSSSICHQQEEAHNMDQQPPTTMLEFNIAATPGWCHYLRSISSDPIQSKLDMERWEAVKSVCILERPSGCTLLRRDFGDFIEVVALMGVIINKPGIVAAVGGIPNALKIEDWIVLEINLDQIKLDTINGDDVDAKEVEYTKIFREDVIQAYRKVCLASSSSTCKQEAEAHSIDPLCPMAEVNIMESQFASASNELNKDNSVEA